MMATGSRKGSAGQDTRALGLRTLAILLGMFFVFTGLAKIAWLTDSSLLAGRFEGYLSEATPAMRWYIETIAVPGLPVFARLVPAAEIATGAALVAGFWTRLAAGLAFVMVLNFHFASGALLRWDFLGDGMGFPVMGGLLALAIGGKNLPFAVSR